MIPVATILGLAAYSSARTPLRELVPFMPIALSLLLLLTSYSLPRFSSNGEGYIPLHQEISLEDGPSEPTYGSNIATSWPRRQSGATHGSGDEVPLVPDMCGQCDLQFAHMSRSTSRLSQLRSLHESSIDLNEPLSQLTPQLVSRWATLVPNALQGGSEFQTIGMFTGSTYHCRGCHGGFEGPSTSSTDCAQCPSASARSESPLLEQVPHSPSGP